MTAWDDLVEITKLMAAVTLIVGTYVGLFGLVIWGICSLAGWT